MAEKPVETLNGREKAYLPPAAPPRNHGHTVAAWVTVTVILVGALVASAGVVAALPWLFWTGLGIAVLGLIVGYALRKAGLGQPEPSAPARDGAGDDA
jgi:hypothetical protein